jgi:hypothetical protein
MYMEHFVGLPLFLDVGDYITFKVRVANSNGWSNFSPEVNGATVRGKP